VDKLEVIHIESTSYPQEFDAYCSLLLHNLY